MMVHTMCVTGVVARHAPTCGTPCQVFSARTFEKICSSLRNSSTGYVVPREPHPRQFLVACTPTMPLFEQARAVYRRRSLANDLLKDSDFRRSLGRLVRKRAELYGLETEDLGQEVAICIARDCDKGRFPDFYSNRDGCLKRVAVIVRNTAIGVLRKKGARIRLVPIGDDIDGRIVESGDPESSALRAELPDVLHAWMMVTLDERERQILILRFFEGYTVDQISQILGIPRGTIYRIRARSLRKLRNRDEVYHGL